jgi:hypothetical protein
MATGCSFGLIGSMHIIFGKVAAAVRLSLPTFIVNHFG